MSEQASPKAPAMSKSSLLPADDDLELLHTRNYETRVYLLADDQLLVRGALSDMKPPGLYVTDDPEPLEIHQMHVQLTVKLPDMTIVDAQVGFETHPHSSCPKIIDSYKQLIGLNVARGFTRKVRELFGGPRGCAHTTALLQAMAPAVVQSLWSVNVKKARAGGMSPGASSEKRRELAMAGNLNTCHIWDEEGEHVAAIRRGEPSEPPIQIGERLVKLGRKPDEWIYGRQDD